MIKEAIISALMDSREYIDEKDIERGMLVVLNRDLIRHSSWL